MLTQEEIKKIWDIENILPEYKKSNLVVKYGLDFGCKVLVETGTYTGETVQIAKPHFEDVYSVEIDKHWYEHGLERFQADKNVHLFWGDSGDKLKEMVSLINKKTIFYLDAHFNYGTHPPQFNRTLDELDTIFESLPDSIILIDDARLFTAGEYHKDGKSNPAEWFLNPRLDILEQYIQEKNPALVFDVTDDVIRVHP